MMHNASVGSGQPVACARLGESIIVLCGVSRCDNVHKGHVLRILMILKEMLEWQSVRGWEALSIQHAAFSQDALHPCRKVAEH
jgi:hypothetical protein